MGLDVGVVSINYLDRPSEAAYNFAWHLMHTSLDADWSVSEGVNAFVEYTRDTMSSQMEKYLSSVKLAPYEKDAVRAWVKELPWRGDVIMLHLSF